MAVLVNHDGIDVLQQGWAEVEIPPETNVEVQGEGGGQGDKILWFPRQQDETHGQRPNQNIVLPI